MKKTADRRIVKVLYLHPMGSFGGSSRSLLELLRAFPKGSVQPYIISQRVQVAAIFENENILVIPTLGLTQFDNTFYSRYRGLRWLVLLRELAFFLPTVIALRSAKRTWGSVDIIHVNELTGMPAAILAKLLFKAPLVVHVRSVQYPMTSGLRGKFLKHLIRRYVDQLVAIDCTVRESLPKDFSVAIVRNGFPFSDTPPTKKDAGSNPDFSPEQPLRVGCVGGLTKLKGVYEVVEAARICIKAGLAVEFHFVGENPRNLRGVKGYLLKRFGFAADVQKALESLIVQYDLGDRVKIHGFTTDVKRIYDSIDVLCFASHLNACGRPVFEAAFSRVPSIVAVSNPLKDTIVDGQTGICIPAKNPAAIADAVSYFYAHPGELARMGDAAYQLALRNFDIAANAARMIEVYNHLLGKDAPRESFVEKRLGQC